MSSPKATFTYDLKKGAKEFLSEKGFDPKYGARPLKRAIQRYVEDPLAEELLNSEKAEGSTIRIKMNASRDNLMFEWKDAEVTDEEESEKKAEEESK